MFKYNYFQLDNINSKQELNQFISKKVETLYDIGAESVLTKIIERENLGSVEIGTNFDLPHIEYDGQEQGIILVNYKINNYYATSLFIILNVVYLDKDLGEFLNRILNDAGLDKLRNCRNINDLQRIVEGG